MKSAFPILKTLRPERLRNPVNDASDYRHHGNRDEQYAPADKSHCSAKRGLWRLPVVSDFRRADKLSDTGKNVFDRHKLWLPIPKDRLWLPREYSFTRLDPSRRKPIKRLILSEAAFLALSRRRLDYARRRPSRLFSQKVSVRLKNGATEKRRITSAVWPSDGSDTNIQDIHDNDAATGDSITLPVGTFSWAVGVILTKAIHLQGAGAGRVVARSRVETTFGTGSKTFTIQDPANGLPIDATIASIANGTTLRIWRLGTDKDVDFMLGTKTSLVGDQLTVNVTTNTGAGDTVLLLFATEDSTRVVHDAGAATLVDIQESTAGFLEISGIQFTIDTGTGYMMGLQHTDGGEPLLIHDCWWNQTITGKAIIENHSVNRGVISDCSVTWTMVAQSNSQFFHSQPNARTESWSAPDTMGTDDTTGKSNIYFEDIDVHGNTSAATDFDANTRVVWRYNLNNHAALNSHGSDTGPIGVRQVEVYRNRFEFHDFGDGDGSKTLALAQHWLLRGGTGVFHHNYVERILSTAWANPDEIQFGVFALSGANVLGGDAWGAGDGGVPNRPACRQIGMGWIDGTTLDGLGNLTEGGISIGDRVPVYIYANTGDAYTISKTRGVGVVVDPDDPVDYIRAGIEYFDDGTEKPAYTEFEYPHPLREGGALPGPMEAPQFTVDPVVTGTPEVGQTLTSDDGTVTGNPVPTITYQWYRCTTP